MIQADTLNKLKNIIAGNRFVNCFTHGFSEEKSRELDEFLASLKAEYRDKILVAVDIQAFAACENEEKEAAVLVDAINREFAAKGLTEFSQHVISVSNAIHMWGKDLDERVLLVFHCFRDLYSENEKNILRSLRKTHRNERELSSYLRILIVSDRKISRWLLFPESNLDERHATLFELAEPSIQAAIEG